MTYRLSLPFALALLSGCFNAGLPQGPDAGIDADGGVPGAANAVCNATAECSSADLTCVNQGDTLRCRVRCDLDATDDPCGPGYTCQRAGTGGACVPGNTKGAPCPCDEGFSCATVTSDAGLDDTRCRTSCSPADAGAACGDGERCRAFAGEVDKGACL